MVLCPGAPEGSTGSGSDFKASQKTGHRLKSHPTDWKKPGIEPATPGLQGIALIHYTNAREISFLQGRVKIG